MRDVVVKRIIGYFAMIVTIVAIGLPLHLLIEWATGKKLVFVQSFLVYFVGILLGQIVYSQSMRLFAKTEAQRKQHPKSARARKIETLLETSWAHFLLIVVCGAIAGAIVAVLD